MGISYERGTPVRRSQDHEKHYREVNTDAIHARLSTPGYPRRVVYVENKMQPFALQAFSGVNYTNAFI